MEFECFRNSVLCLFPFSAWQVFIMLPDESGEIDMESSFTMNGEFFEGSHGINNVIDQ